MPDTHDTAQTTRELGERYADDIIALRRHFHQHPELSAQEHATSDYICAHLDELGIPYERIVGPRPEGKRDERDEFIGTGIIATIRGEAPDAYDANGQPAKRVALRCDMDALPVAEKTELPFASQNDGVMHACGHDCHMAMQLGAARILMDMRNQLHGEVRLIFQPAEEISIGARDMIAAGALDGVDAIFGQHVWSEVDAGTFSAEPGSRMGNTDWFRIDIEGVSAHGSMPHKGLDAIVVACEIVDALQLLVSRRSSPFNPSSSPSARFTAARPATSWPAAPISPEPCARGTRRRATSSPRDSRRWAAALAAHMARASKSSTRPATPPW